MGKRAATGVDGVQNYRQECLCYIFSRGWRDPAGYNEAGRMTDHQGRSAESRVIWPDFIGETLRISVKKYF